MAGDHAVGMLLFDQLEAAHGYDANTQAWELEGTYGRDLDKLWVRAEGERRAGTVRHGDVEAFWYHGIAAYWGSQLGMRHDFGVGPQRQWAAIGVEGLAPYFFDVQATAYIGSAGRTAARFRADYEVLFSQRLMLQPELEFNFHGKDDPARKTGRGLSDVSLGLRLRYEILRQFAPYIGISWVRRVGKTANYARADGEQVFEQQFVAGIRLWF
ncbi:MAG TPA: copper resistance protein B [Rhodanobacter sp.]|nr:copper resistance protein B [Rhodanobacter sp.]